MSHQEPGHRGSARSPDVLDPQLRGNPDPDSKIETRQGLVLGDLRLVLVVAGSGSPHIFPANYPEDKNMLALIKQPQCKTKSLIIKRLFNI